MTDRSLCLAWPASGAARVPLDWAHPALALQVGLCSAAQEGAYGCVQDSAQHLLHDLAYGC